MIHQRALVCFLFVFFQTAIERWRIFRRAEKHNILVKADDRVTRRLHGALSHTRSTERRVIRSSSMQTTSAHRGTRCCVRSVNLITGSARVQSRYDPRSQPIARESAVAPLVNTAGSAVCTARVRRRRRDPDADCDPFPFRLIEIII